MALGLIGVNHLTEVELRERFSFTPDELAPALKGLLELEGVSEAVILTTCNRTEIYYVSEGRRACEGSRTGSAGRGPWIESSSMRRPTRWKAVR